MARARREIEEDKELHREKMQKEREEWEAAQQKIAKEELEKFEIELEQTLAHEQALMDRELQETFKIYKIKSYYC